MPSELAAGEVRTSKGGFTIAERNTGKVHLDVVVVEPVTAPTDPFAAPIANFRYHDTAVGPLFESANLRAYEVTMAAGGRTEKHVEQYDRVLIAIDDVNLSETREGGTPASIEQPRGGVLWLAHSSAPGVLSNVGQQPARFIVLEVAPLSK